MFRIPTIITLEKKLAPTHLLPQDVKTIRQAGRHFRRLWQTKSMLEAGFPDVGGTPRITPGSCIFAAATAHALFGAHIQGNWQHVWTQGESLIDLTGLADIRIEKTIIAHVAMLRKRGYIVTGTGNGTWKVELPLHKKHLTYPPVDAANYFQHDPNLMKDRAFRENFSSVIPRAKKWAKAIRFEIR